jgi:hypothetical protein
VLQTPGTGANRIGERVPHWFDSTGVIGPHVRAFDNRLHERRELEADLRTAIQQRRFEIH